MNNENNDNFKDEVIFGKNLMIGIVTESGEVMWISSGENTIQQKKQFQKMYAVTHKPSIVMRIILFIEITNLKIINFFEKDVKGEKN
jgi:hypothetical protein